MNAENMKWKFLNASFKSSLLSAGHSGVLLLLLRLDPAQHPGLRWVWAGFVFWMVFFCVLAAGLLVLSFFVKEDER